MFECDGRLKGTENITTVPCNQNTNTCDIKVPAPGFALVFMDDAALAEAEPTSTVTYATTAVTRLVSACYIRSNINSF